jgi:hypothetical protein
MRLPALGVLVQGHLEPLRVLATEMTVESRELAVDGVVPCQRVVDQCLGR